MLPHDDLFFLDNDPRKLLPFTRELEPEDPNVERLPMSSYQYFEENTRERGYPQQKVANDADAAYNEE